MMITLNSFFESTIPNYNNRTEARTSGCLAQGLQKSYEVLFVDNRNSTITSRFLHESINDFEFKHLINIFYFAPENFPQIFIVNCYTLITYKYTSLIEVWKVPTIHYFIFFQFV